MLTISNQIEITKINSSIKDFITESLTMMNPKWLENERMGRWNKGVPQKLHFYSKNNNAIYIPRGFLEELIYFCSENNFKVKIQDSTMIYKSINFKFSGQLRNYQIDATNEMLKYDVGVLCSPTGSGKTTMGIYILSQRKQPTIILVHTKELLYQWVDRIKELLAIESGVIGDGKKNIKPVTIALVQTLRNNVKLIDRFSHLIIDECHHIPSTTFSNINCKFKGKYITGLSATPYRRDGLSKLIAWYGGPIRYEVRKAQLQKEGHITYITPIIRNTKFKTALEFPEHQYSKLLSEIALDVDRNAMIVADIKKAILSGEVCLILSDRKSHCEQLHKIISIKDCTVLTGNTNSSDRKQIVSDINSGKLKILIATSQLIGEGFDCKNLSSLFLTMPIKYTGRIFQYIGRVLRPKDGKKIAYVYDYFDENIECLYGSYRSRMRAYKQLQK